VLFSSQEFRSGSPSHLGNGSCVYPAMDDDHVLKHIKELTEDLVEKYEQ